MSDNDAVNESGEPVSKLARVIAALEKKNICLPEDFTFDKPHSLDMLLGAIETNVATEAKNPKRAPRGQRFYFPPKEEDEEEDTTAFSERRTCTAEQANRIAVESLRRHGF